MITSSFSPGPLIQESSRRIARTTHKVRDSLTLAKRAALGCIDPREQPPPPPAPDTLRCEKLYEIREPGDRSSTIGSPSLSRVVYEASTEVLAIVRPGARKVKRAGAKCINDNGCFGFFLD